MYQLIKKICEDPKDKTQISLYYLNKTKQDVLMQRELNILQQKYPEKFKVHYALDKYDGRDCNEFERGVSAKQLKAVLPDPKSKSCVLVCGPEG